MKVLSTLTSILVISASLVGCMGESEEKEDIPAVDDTFGNNSNFACGAMHTSGMGSSERKQCPPNH